MIKIIYLLSCFLMFRIYQFSLVNLILNKSTIVHACILANRVRTGGLQAIIT